MEGNGEEGSDEVIGTEGMDKVEERDTGRERKKEPCIQRIRHTQRER